MVGKPARLFSELAPEDGLKLLPLPLPPKLLETYLPSRLTSEDYVRNARIQVEDAAYKNPGSLLSTYVNYTPPSYAPL